MTAFPRIFFANALTACFTGASAQVDYPSKPIRLVVGAKGSTPEAFAALVKADIVNWGKVVKESGAKID